jgi:hypothetical protein
MQFELTPAKRKMQRKARELGVRPGCRASRRDRTEEYFGECCANEAGSSV